MIYPKTLNIPGPCMCQGHYELFEGKPKTFECSSNSLIKGLICSLFHFLYLFCSHNHLQAPSNFLRFKSLSGIDSFSISFIITMVKDLEMGNFVEP